MADPVSEALFLAELLTGSTAVGNVAAFVASNAVYINAAIAFAASTAYGNHQRAKAAAAARSAYNASLKDRELMIQSAVAPRRTIYGRDRVSGPIVYGCTSGEKKEHLHLVITLAGHECDAIEQVWFGDELLPEPNASGDIVSGPFSVSGESEHVANVYANGDGLAELPEVPDAITLVQPTLGQLLGDWVWAPGTSVITGLPAESMVDVHYRKATAAAVRVRIRRYLGGAGQVADTDLIAASGGAWTSAHRGDGICYLYARLTFDQDVFGSIGLPEIKCVVRGKKVRDPRSGLVRWTENSGLIVADWLQDAQAGLRAQADEVPDTEVAAAANICDEMVHLGGSSYQARYTFNGSFTSTETPRAVLQEILSSMAGTCVWSQGRWLVRPGAWRAPALTITADHLAGGTVRIVPRASRGDLFNAVRVVHRDPSQGWAEVQAPLVSNATYEAQDGGVQIVRTITMASAMDAVRAQRLGKIELERARQAVTAELATNLRAYDLAPTDTTTLQLARYGWGAGKAFEVRLRTFDPEAGQISYTLRETAAAVFDWAYGEATVADPAPDTNLPSPFEPPPAPAISTLETGTAHLLPQADGTLITRAWVSWPAVPDQYVASGGHIDLQWRPTSSSTWQPQPPLPGTALGAYIVGLPDQATIIVRARSVNAAGRAGPWAYRAGAVVGKAEPPSSVVDFGVSVSKGRAVWSWAVPTDADWDVIEIRAADAGWGGASAPLFRGRASQWAEVVTAAGTLTRYARHVDTTGNVSVSAASATAAVMAGDLVQDGATTYTWIAYANAADGSSGFTTGAWSGQTYLGVAANKTSATEGTNPSDYTWSLIKGEQGDPGTPGGTLVYKNTVAGPITYSTIG